MGKASMISNPAPIMKNGLFKKILNTESQPSSAATAVTAPPLASHLPPPRRPDGASKSHDPFENDEDFGFSAVEPAPEAIPLAAEPTFAIPEEKQMSQPSPPAPSIPQPPAAYEPIHQLELRAIFGVDHEMNADEILERSRMLKGIRMVSLLAEGDSGTIEALNAMIVRLGLSSEPVQIFAGSMPVDFIREGRVALAVQADDGYPPGVRETLIIVARELAKM